MELYIDSMKHVIATRFLIPIHELNLEYDELSLFIKKIEIMDGNLVIDVEGEILNSDGELLEYIAVLEKEHDEEFRNYFDFSKSREDGFYHSEEPEREFSNWVFLKYPIHTKEIKEMLGV